MLVTLRMLHAHKGQAAALAKVVPGKPTSLLPTCFCNVALFIHCSQLQQQLLSICQPLWVRRIQPGQALAVRAAPAGQLQRQGGQVSRRNLRQCTRQQLVMILAAPEPVTNACTGQHTVMCSSMYWRTGGAVAVPSWRLQCAAQRKLPMLVCSGLDMQPCCAPSPPASGHHDIREKRDALVHLVGSCPLSPCAAPLSPG